MSINWQFKGNDKIKEYFEKVLANNQLAQTYLFSGPEKVGKMTLALRIIGYYLCSGENKPCGICQNCRQLAEKTFPDVLFLDLLEDKKTIGIEQVREFQEKLNRKNFSLPKKLVVFNNADKLTISAMNALLKTLEEPVLNATIFLIANNAEKILPTIKSRCQLISFKRISAQEILDYLSQNFSDQPLEILEQISYEVNGCVGQALDFLNDQELLQNHWEELTWLKQMIQVSYAERFLKIDNLTKEKNNADVSHYLQIINVFFRDLLYLKLGQNQLIVYKSLLPELSNLDKSYSFAKISLIMKEINLALENLEYNVNSKLLLENLFLKI